MKYQEIKELFRKHEDSCPQTHLTAYITFSSFGPGNDKVHSWESRTYMISSDNKAFQPNMGGYSIFGSCLDGTDRCLRIDLFMAEERGGKDGWVVEDCCIIGYLLVEHAVGSISDPQMFCSLEKAQEKMLDCVADFAGVNPALLKQNYILNGRNLIEGTYRAKKYSAFASTVRDTGSWQIKPACIYDVLHIVFDHGRWAE